MIAIYNPKGKAAEYAKWACNFHVGCSNQCTYCYLKKGRGAKILGGNIPQLKKCFKNETHAMQVFEKEINLNKSELQKHGLFFSFTTDPVIKETYGLTILAVNLCMTNDIPVRILTKSKMTDFTLFNWVHLDYHDKYKQLISIGFTLTGHDELEPNASTNKERIEGMKSLHQAGFKTFASIEPIIDFPSAKNMIEESMNYCDLYLIGLMSGKKYNVAEAQNFVKWLYGLNKPRIYLKESLQKLTGYSNDKLGYYFVNKF